MVLCKLLALPVALALFSASYDVDMDYEGEVNIFTGEPIGSEDGTEEKHDVKLSDDGVYDYEQNTYTYFVPGDEKMSVTSSVPNKMITTDSVSLSVEGGVTALVYRDGEMLEEVDLSDIEDPGNYAVVASGAESEYQILAFTIIPEKTGMISSYQLPEGFEVTEVTIDDKEQKISNKSMVKMKDDGTYVIYYRCRTTGMEYGLKVEIDHTPPSVEIEGLKNGKARSAVTVTGMDDDDSYWLEKDGEEYKLPKDGVLKMPGKYELSVTDDAGNTVEEKFEIQFYLDRQGIIFGAIALAVIVGGIVFMIYSRKKLRVR